MTGTQGLPPDGMRAPGASADARPTCADGTRTPETRHAQAPHSAANAESPLPADGSDDRARRAHFARGVVCTLVGAMMWGYMASAMQLLSGRYAVDPTSLALIRTLAAGAILMAAAHVLDGAHLHALLADRTARLHTLAFGAALYGSQLTYIIAIALTNAGTATVLQSLNAVFIMAIACATTRRLPDARQAAGLVCAIAATYLIAIQGAPGTLGISPAGFAWGIGTAVCATVYTLAPRRMFSQFGSLATTACGMMAGAVFAVPVGIARTVATGSPLLPPLDATGVLTIAGVVLIGTVGAYGLFLHGVSLVGGVVGSQLGTAEPVNATILAALWLHTPFTRWDLAGLVLMCATVILVSRPPAPTEKAASDVPENA